MPGIDVRVTVYAPNFSAVTCLDAYAAGDLNGGAIQYEDTASGCGAAKITLGITYETMKSRGYWRGMSIVEISTGDNTLKTSAAAGANKYYLDSTWGFDPAQGEDAQQAYFYDGSTLTMRVPVTGVGSDAGGSYITTSAPLGGGSVPAYTAGTIVGRRRYAGRIIRRSISVQRLPGNIDIQLTGLAVAFTQAYSSFTISIAANVDVGPAIYNSLVPFQASHWPFLAPIVSANFPTTGYITHFTLTNVGCDSLISNALDAITSADQWVVRVGHDRVPRLIKLFTQATNSYTYNVTLTQGTLEAEPVSISFEDEDSSNIFNSVLITGDTDPTTNQPVTAIVQDTPAATIYGFQIDGAPVNNIGIKDVTGAANYGLGEVDQYALPVAKNQVVVFTKNDIVKGPTPGGMQAGDLVRASACLTIAGFDQTGLVTNNAPDSGIQYGTGTSALWAVTTGTLGTTVNLVAGGSPDGYNAWTLAASSTSLEVTGPPEPCAPGEVFTFQGGIDPSGATVGSGSHTATWFILNQNLAVIGSVVVNFGAAGGLTTPFTFTVPASTTALVIAAASSGNASATGVVKFYQPNLAIGTRIFPYVVNLAAPNVYGLPSSVVTTIDFDKHDTSQAVSFASVEPDFSAEISEAANALATALRSNSSPLNAIDRYCVSSNARNYTVSSTSLSVTLPALLAIWAPSSGAQAPVSVPMTTVTCVASASNWVWLLSNSTYAVYQTAAPVQGAILMAIFQMSATGWMGDSGLKASVGVMQIGLGNVNVAANLPAPNLSGHTVTNGAALNTLSTIVNDTVTYTNAPTDGSATQLVYYYAATGTGNWIAGMELNLYIAPGAQYPNATHTLAAQLDLNNGASYDFAVGFAGLAGYGPLTQFVTGFAANAASVPISYQPGGVPTAPTFSGVTVANGISYDGVHADVTVAFTVTNQDPGGSLSAMQLWIRVSARGGSNVPGAATFYWGGAGGQPAVGVGNAPGSCPTSGTYYFAIPNVTNGSVIDVGASFEDARGGQSTVGVIQSSFTAQALDIPASATSFNRLLTSGFYGLSIDPATGLLIMPNNGGQIFPSAFVSLIVPFGGPTQPASPLTFTMKSALTTTGSAASYLAGVLTDASPTSNSFANGYFVIYTGGTPSATLALYKAVGGVNTLLASRSGAIASPNYFYPAVPGLPPSDPYMHELTVFVNPLSTGIQITVLLDGAVTMNVYEATSGTALPQISNYWYYVNAGGVAPFMSGTCGPGVGAHAVYLDQTDLKILNGTSTFSEVNSSQIAAVVKTAQQQATTSSPSPLATATVARETVAGTTGHGTNLVFNPTAMRGYAGWQITTNDTGAPPSIYTDQNWGGRFIIIYNAGTHTAANDYGYWSQYLNTNAYNTLVASTTYTLSVQIELDTLQSGAYAFVAVVGLPSDTTGTYFEEITTLGTTLVTLTFTTGVNAFSSPYVQFGVVAGPKTTTVATTAIAYKFMLEQGAVATTYADSYADGLVTQTHDTNGNIVAGLTKSTALTGQASVLPTSSTFALTCTPVSSKTSYGSNGSPTPSATYSKITVSWAAYTVTFPNGATQSFNASSGTIFVSGFPVIDTTVPLLPSTSYYVTVWAVAGSPGSTVIAFTTTALTQLEGAEVYQDGLITLAVNQGPITTPAQPASGTTTGGGYVPPPNTCPAVGQTVQTRRGLIPAEDLVEDDELLDFEEGIYNRVLRPVEIIPSEIFRVTIAGETFDVDRDHLWAWKGGWWPMHSLHAGDHLLDATGGELIVEHVESLGDGQFVGITCERHRYRMGRAIAHNVITGQPY